MNNRTSFVLLAFLTAVGTLTMTSAYAEHSEGGDHMIDHSDIPQACVGCAMEDARVTANRMLLDEIPISVWTDKTDYKHNNMIMVEGKVANVVPGYPVTVTVVSPLNSIVTVDQLIVKEDGSFETMINTAGTIWKYDGTYIINVNYGSSGKSNSVQVELMGSGIKSNIVYETPDSNKQCGPNDLTVRDQCIPFSITGGSVTRTMLNPGVDGSIVIRINAEDDGTLTVTPSEITIKGIHTVLVDGEQCNEPECETVGNKVTVMFQAGTEVIRIFGAHVIPEFGTIAAMILAVAIISIIAVSARSRLGIIPRY